MFDNHIQNIWVAQRKGKEENKEIEGEGSDGVGREKERRRWSGRKRISR